MRQRTSGFTLIELMVVIVIILIIVAIAVPLLLRYRIGANEGSAIGAMRTISSAQVGFQAAGIVDDDDDGLGDFGTLEQLGNPAEDTEPFIDSALARGFRQGYSFTIEVFPGDHDFPPLYSARATPLAQGKTGIRHFYVDQSNVLRFTSDGSVPDANSTPLN